MSLLTISAGSQLSNTFEDAFQDTTQAIGRFFGASYCSDNQKKAKRNIADLIRQHLSATDIQDLIRGTESDIAPTPDALADFYLGGRDCKHKNVSPGDQRFLDNLRPLIEKRAREAQQMQKAPGEGTPVQATSAGVLPANLFSNSNSLWLLAGVGVIAFFASKYKK